MTTGDPGMTTNGNPQRFGCSPPVGANSFGSEAWWVAASFRRFLHLATWMLAKGLQMPDRKNKTRNHKARELEFTGGSQCKRTETQRAVCIEGGACKVKG